MNKPGSNTDPTQPAAAPRCPKCGAQSIQTSERYDNYECGSIRVDDRIHGAIFCAGRADREAELRRTLRAATCCRICQAPLRFIDNPAQDGHCPACAERVKGLRSL